MAPITSPVTMEDQFQLHTPKSRSATKIFALLLLSLIGFFIILFVWKLVAAIWIIRYGDEAEKQTLSERVNPSFTASPELNLRYRTKSSKIEAAKLQTTYSPQTGPATAPIKMVAFIDFDCPYTQSTYPILRKFITEHEGLIQLTVRHFPITPLHPNALSVALASTCASEQKKFFPYADQIFDTKKDDPESLIEFAQNIGLDMEQFKLCLASEKHLQDIQKDMQEGADIGIRGTPTFVIGTKKVEGTIDTSMWEQLTVDALQK